MVKRKVLIAIVSVFIAVALVLLGSQYNLKDNSDIILSMEFEYSYYFKLQESRNLTVLYGDGTGIHGEFNEIYKERRKKLTEQEYKNLIGLADTINSVDFEEFLILSSGGEVEVVYKGKT